MSVIGDLLFPFSLVALIGVLAQIGWQMRHVDRTFRRSGIRVDA
ncbi:hypothetical protein [Phaeobacter sp. J2-8]|nr:hypothetical protein [Phaeobacter sp. J2-8]